MTLVSSVVATHMRALYDAAWMGEWKKLIHHKHKRIQNHNNNQKQDLSSTSEFCSLHKFCKWESIGRIVGVHENKTK